MRSYQEDGPRLFTVVYGRRTRGNGHVETREAQTGLNETFFIMQTVSYRNILPREVVQFSTMEVFKTQLGKALSNLVCPQSLEQYVGLQTS